MIFKRFIRNDEISKRDGIQKNFHFLVQRSRCTRRLMKCRDLCCITAVNIYLRMCEKKILAKFFREKHIEVQLHVKKFQITFHYIKFPSLRIPFCVNASHAYEYDERRISCHLKTRKTHKHTSHRDDEEVQ